MPTGFCFPIFLDESLVKSKEIEEEEERKKRKDRRRDLEGFLVWGVGVESVAL